MSMYGWVNTQRSPPPNELRGMPLPPKLAFLTALYASSCLLVLVICLTISSTNECMYDLWPVRCAIAREAN